MEQIVLTGIPHVDNKILDRIDDVSLIKLATSDRAVQKLVEDPNSDLWKRRIMKNFPGALDYKKNLSYKDYYINLRRYLKSDLSNNEFYKTLMNSEDGDQPDENTARITTTLHYNQFQVADYMFSLGYRPLLTFNLFDNSERTFIWLWDHELEFDSEILFEAIYSKYTDEELMREVITTLYGEGSEAFKMENPTGKYEYQARMFQELFTQELMPGLFFIGLHELIDLMIQDLGIHPDHRLVNDVISNKSKSPEEIKDIMDKYHIEPHEEMLIWAINAGWIEFFDGALNFNPPLLPNQGILDMITSSIPNQPINFLTFKKIFSIIEDHNIPYVWNQEIIDEGVFMLKYDENYGIHYPSIEEVLKVKIDYEGDKQTEVWQWFLERELIPSPAVISKIVKSRLGVQLVLLLLQYKPNYILEHLLKSRKVAIALLSLYLQYICHKDITINVSVIYEKIHSIYVRKVLFTERTTMFIDWLDQVISDYDILSGDRDMFIQMSKDLAHLRMHSLATKIVSRFELPPVSREEEYEYNVVIGEDILYKIKDIFTREKRHRSFNFSDRIVIDGLYDIDDNDMDTYLTVEQLTDLVETLILLNLTSLAKKMFDIWIPPLTIRIYNRWDNVFVIKRKIELFGVLPELSYFEGQMIDMDLESIQQLLESYE